MSSFDVGFLFPLLLFVCICPVHGQWAVSSREMSRCVRLVTCDLRGLAGISPLFAHEGLLVFLITLRCVLHVFPFWRTDPVCICCQVILSGLIAI